MVYLGRDSVGISVTSNGYKSLQEEVEELQENYSELTEEVATQILVTDTEPAAETNKLWIDPEADEQFTVPTYTEFSALSETVSGKYTKPPDGIPASDMASGVIPVVHNVPDGGNTGQVLAKASGTDYDLTWVNHPALTSLIDDTAGQGATARVWSSDKSYSESLLKQAKITASGILKGDGNGGVSAATAGTDYLVSHQDISGKADKSGTVLSTTLSMGRKANTTAGTHSTALGENLTASGTHSVAVNHSNTASGAFALAAGYGSTASGKGSFAGGLNSNALGETSFAYGQAARSNSNGMTAVGVFNTNATLFPDWVANTSYSVGDKVKVSNGLGYRCKTANSDSTFTDSKWTKLFTNGDTAFVVGNSVDMSLSSNAMKVDWEGNGYFNGDLYVNCAADSTNGMKVATEIVVENVTGSTPSITGVDNHRYMCGTVSTISVTPPSNGFVDIVFTSGSTPAVLTVNTATGVTMKWPEWFNPTNLSSNATYEVNIMDGRFGVVMKWT